MSDYSFWDACPTGSCAEMCAPCQEHQDRQAAYFRTPIRWELPPTEDDARNYADRPQKEGA